MHPNLPISFQVQGVQLTGSLELMNHWYSSHYKDMKRRRLDGSLVTTEKKVTIRPMPTVTYLDAANLPSGKIWLLACDSFRKPKDEQLDWALMCDLLVFCKSKIGYCHVLWGFSGEPKQTLLLLETNLWVFSSFTGLDTDARLSNF